MYKYDKHKICTKNKIKIKERVIQLSQQLAW